MPAFTDRWFDDYDRITLPMRGFRRATGMTDQRRITSASPPAVEMSSMLASVTGSGYLHLADSHSGMPVVKPVRFKISAPALHSAPPSRGVSGCALAGANTDGPPLCGCAFVKDIEGDVGKHVLLYTPIRPRRRASTKSVRVSTPKRSAAASAWRRSRRSTTWVACYQRVKELGFEMALSVGQHTNDKELSYCARTPPASSGRWAGIRSSSTSPPGSQWQMHCGAGSVERKLPGFECLSQHAPVA